MTLPALPLLILGLGLPTLATADSIMFTVEGLRNGEGTLAYQLCRAEEFEAALPDGQPCAIQGDIEAQPEVTRFGLSLEDGTYAVILRHDEARDGTGQGLGFSNNPDLRLGLPDFATVALAIEGRMGAYIRLTYPE